MYDPMVAKLIVWDVDREHATRRMLRALDEYEIGGLTTLIPFHKAILATEQWVGGETCRDLMEDRDWLKSTAPETVALRLEPMRRRREQIARDYKVEVSGKLFDVKVIGEAVAGARRPGRRRQAAAQARAQSRAARRAPPASRCPRRCRARCSRSRSSRAPRSPRAT